MILSAFKTTTPVIKNNAMIQLSASAATEIKRLLKKQRQQNTFFRLQVKPGGCSGLYYNMTFDANTTSGDRVCDCRGISVVVDAQSWSYIGELVIDYSEDLMGGGFRFYNPHASSTCGCGNSFSI